VQVCSRLWRGPRSTPYTRSHIRRLFSDENFLWPASRMLSGHCRCPLRKLRPQQVHVGGCHLPYDMLQSFMDLRSQQPRRRGDALLTSFHVCHHGGARTAMAAVLWRVFLAQLGQTVSPFFGDSRTSPPGFLLANSGVLCKHPLLIALKPGSADTSRLIRTARLPRTAYQLQLHTWSSRTRGATTGLRILRPNGQNDKCLPVFIPLLFR
jgi:hypothetical protein